VSVRDEQGFTLVEVLVAATVLVVGVLALLMLLDTANAGTSVIRAREGATNLGRQVTEAARSVPYRTLTPQSIETELRAQPGLAHEGGGSGWTIERRGFRYTLAASVCSVDDPADGVGPHDVGVYCPGPATSASTDRNPDDYKRVTIDITWRAQSRDHHVRQVVVVNNPGSAGGPAVQELALAPPASTLITSDLAAAGLTATTSSPATSVVFSVDGAMAATANGSATNWTFSWGISQLVDGTHLVTAQAFDESGLSGATRSVTVTLNRFVPTAPTGVAGGRNGSVVEFEWLPNPERDIVGYRVFRVVPGGPDVAVCSLTRATTCQDTNPPSGPVSYYVVAVDLDPGGVHRDGPGSAPITVTTANSAPEMTSPLTATHSDGVTTLQWTAATDPDGDDIAFYRIYRDGTAFADRYDRTGTGTELSFADGHTDGTEHEYWVAAVDGQLAESPLVGPVTR